MIGIVTMDLDSTVADTTHRQDMITRDEDGKPTTDMDWVAYAMACGGDTVISAMFRLAHMLAAQNEIHYLTSRSGQARVPSQSWIKDAGLPCDGLWMFEEGDLNGSRESHAEYKLRTIQRIQEVTGKEVLLHVDDWAEVKVVLEAHGFPCICVRTPSEVLELTASV